MLNCYNQIIIQQIPNINYPNRNRIVIINTINNLIVTNSNEDLIQTAEFTLSRKLKSVIMYGSNYVFPDSSLIFSNGTTQPFIPKKSDVKNPEIYILQNVDFETMGQGEIIKKAEENVVNSRKNLVDQLNDINAFMEDSTAAKIAAEQLVNNSRTVEALKNDIRVPNPPLFIYGDMIQIYAGYTYYDNGGNQRSTIEDGNFQNINGVEYYTGELYLKLSEIGKGRERSLLFTGYVTEISAGFDIKVKCQDYMAYFFQLKCPDVNILSINKDKAKTDFNGECLAENWVHWDYGTLQGGILGLFDMINGLEVLKRKKDPEALKKFLDANRTTKLKPIYTDGRVEGQKLITDFFNLKFNDTTSSDRFGDLKGMNYTVGNWFKEIKDKGWGHVFFYPNSYTLNTSIFRYNHNPFSKDNPNGFQEFTFAFQENIIHNKLEYKRTDTLLQGAIIKSTFNVTGFVKRVEGVEANTKTTKTGPIQIFVGTPGGNTITIPYGRSSEAPATQADVDKIEELMEAWGVRRLADIHYEGYKGSITVMGYPYVRHGDQITIEDKNYPERKGKYMCNKVVYTSSVSGGLKQEIFLGEKISKRTYITNQTEFIKTTI